MEHTNIIYHLIILLFLLYFIVTYIFKILGIRNLNQALYVNHGLLLSNVKHLLGILIFGFLSYILFPQFRPLLTGFRLPDFEIIVLSIAVTFISGFLSFESAKRTLKSVRTKSNYSFNQGWHYFLIRIIFLCTYEFFFRGVLLFALIPDIGFVSAIAVSTILYVLIHIFDSNAEIFGAIPFGIILCLITYTSDSIWIAFGIHLILSLINEFSIYRELTVKKLKS